MNIFSQTILRATRQTRQTSPQTCINLLGHTRTKLKLGRSQIRPFTTPPKRIYTNMAHSTTEDLSKNLQALGLKEQLDTYPNSYPELNPTDVYRAHLTSILTEITGVDKSIIYPVLQWTQTLEKGDLVLPVPALRVKGKKPNELAEEWAAKVLRRGQWHITHED